MSNVKVNSITFVDKWKAYRELGKLRLSSLVVFSTLIGYVLANPTLSDVNILHVLALSFGGMLVTISANTVNQIIEINSDALMNRTKTRPLPTSRLSVVESRMFALITLVIGSVTLFYFFGALAMLLSLISFVLYAFIYTPMKKISPIAVLIGAFPGAFPPLIGWVAYTGSIDLVGIVLFGIQFFWQFPHFWAIAWVADEDYTRAGFKLLPSKEGKNLNTAFQIMIYTLLLIPMGMLPYYLKITGVTSMIVAVLAGTIFLIQTFALMRSCDTKAARNIMFGSFLYLPIVQIAFVFDKI